MIVKSVKHYALKLARALPFWIGILLAVIMGAMTAYASPEQCQPVGDYDKAVYTPAYYVCSASTQADIRLFWGEAGQNYGHFDNVDKALTPQGYKLRLAMNAGMYHQDRAPVGLYIDEHGTKSPLQVGASYGNFGLVPNGVFYKDGDSFHVTETKAFQTANLSPEFATQSGPMLLVDGAYHPKFNPNSSSKRIRNGIAVDPKGEWVYFVKSEVPMNFYEFASIFKDHLKVDNALYLDGTISRLFDAETGRNDLGLPMGPILGVVRPMDKAVNAAARP